MALNDYDTLITGAAAQYNIDPRLLKSVMSVESNGVPNAVGPLITKGPAAGQHAQGLMQFIPGTAATYGVKDPFNPTQSIYGGAHYLSDLLNQHGSVDAAINAYSGGGGANYASQVVAAYKTMPPIAPATQPATGNAPSASPPAPAAYSPQRPPPTPGTLITSGAVPGLISDRGQGTPTPLARSLVAAGVNPPTEPPNNIPSPSSNENQPPPPASSPGKTVLSPEEQQLIGGTPQKPAATAPAASPPPSATTLSPEEQQLVGASPQTAPKPPPAPAPQLAGAPPAPPGVDPLTYALVGSPSDDAVAATISPTGPLIPTQGQLAAQAPGILPGISHGLREAVNPVLEWGSSLGNRLANATGWDALRTDRVANDAASEAAFNAQYGGTDPASQAAQGTAGVTRVVAPLAIGGALGTATRAGLEAANLPRLASYLSGGGIPGAGGAWGVGNRLLSGAVTGGYQGLATGGPWGAIGGASIGLGLAPVGVGLQAIENRIAPEGVAARQIYQNMIRDGMSPAQAQAQLDRMGNLGTLADIPNAVPARNLGTLAEGVANAPGPGQQIAAENVVPRMQGQAGRLTQAVMRATGNPQSAFQEAQDLVEAQRTAARPLFENAFNNTPIRMQASAQMAPYVDTPIGQRALQDGIANAQAEAVRAGQPFNMADYGVVQNPDGSLAIQPWNASLRTYDAIKRGYDQLAESLRDPTTLRMNYSGTVPTPGGANVSARNVIGMRDDVTRILRQNYPEYADALNAWAGPAQSLDALRMGQNVLNQDAEQTAASIAKFSPQQREMYQAGIAQTLRDRILRTSGQATEAGAGMTPPNAVRAIFGNDLMRERIAAGFGGEQAPAFQQFANDMENEAAFAGAARYTAGSPTAGRTAAIQLAQGGSGLNVVRPLMHVLLGSPATAGADIAHQIGGHAIERALAPSERVNQALGNFLFNPQSQAQIMNMLAARPGPSARQALMSPWGQASAQALLEARQRAAAPP